MRVDRRSYPRGELPVGVGPKGGITVMDPRAVIPPKRDEIHIWSVKNYRITFDPLTKEMVYRVKVPIEKLKDVI